jgi:nitroreductase
MFPTEWQTPDFKPGAKPDFTPDVEADALGTDGISSRQRALLPGPVMLVVVYDPTRRAPASEGDFLGIISLGCLMENLWLEAEALGLGVQIVSSLADAAALKDILGIPEHLRVAFSVRLGHPVSEPADYLRVRRDLEDFTFHNRYGG